MLQNSDEELMEIFLHGTDHQRHIAFDGLYHRYSQRLLEYFFFMLDKDHEKAQDFMHNLFIKIIEKPALFDRNKKFSSWIFSIAANMCKNEFRRIIIRKNYQKDFKVNLSESNSQNNFPDIKIVREAINSLEENQKTAIILRYKFDLSIKEIAEITGASEGTIKSRLFYAIKKMSNHYVLN